MPMMEPEGGYETTEPITYFTKSFSGKIYLNIYLYFFTKKLVNTKNSLIKLVSFGAINNIL